MATVENNTEDTSTNLNNVHSANQVQFNHQFAQPIQTSYWIPGNNNMGITSMPNGFHGYAPLTFYNMSTMMPTSMMPMGSPNLYNAPAYQNYQPYFPIQQSHQQMFMPTGPVPMIFCNPMFSSNQHPIVDSNHVANSTSPQDSVQRSMNNGIVPLLDTSSRVTSSQSPINNADPSRTCETSCETQSFGQDPASKSTKDSSVSETENSLSQEAELEVSNGQSFVDNPHLSEICEKQSEQNVVPPPISISSSTSSPRALNDSTNASPIRALEFSVPAAVTRSSAFSSSVPAVKTKNIQKRRFSQCNCPNCKAGGRNKPRFRNGTLQHICHFRNCGRVFNRPASLKKHIKWHDGKKYFCAQCSQGFARKMNLSAHIETHETTMTNISQSLNSKGSKNSNGRGQYVCNMPNCGKIYSYGWVLQRHLRWHENSKKNFICKYCDKEYGRQGMLTSHMKNVHMSKPSESKCTNFNGRPLSSYSVREASPQEFDINFDLESTSSKHACQFSNCGKEYMSFERLKEHTKCHFDAAPYVCRWPSCGKKFTRASYLQAHQVVHTDKEK